MTHSTHEYREDDEWRMITQRTRFAIAAIFRSSQYSTTGMYNKGGGICYPVCGMMHIKEPLLLNGKSSPCGGSGFPLSLC